MATAPTRLKRELGTVGATVLGLGSILGTGVFVSIGLAAGIAGPAVLLSIALAGALATCNALSSAQLAAAYPVSGGAYEYGYRLLTPGIGFSAGWLFLCAKSASAATAALGAASYAVNISGYELQTLLPWLSCTISLVITALILSGLRRSNMVNLAIVATTVFALTAFAVASLSQLSVQTITSNFTPFFNAPETDPLSGVLHAAALMFVAYTGYGRIATMGEDVRTPRKTIPRAIIATLAISAVLYMLVALGAVGAVGAQALGNFETAGSTPLETAAAALHLPHLSLLVSVGAFAAMVGVLLNLILGLSRVTLAMARRGDMPSILGRLTANQSPAAAIIFAGVIVCALSIIGDIKTVWSFSAFTVLVYYSITNIAALRLPKSRRLYPRTVSWTGLAGCVSLATFLPFGTWLSGLALLAAGYLWHRYAWGAKPIEEGNSPQA